MIPVGVVGAAGFTGVELVKILLSHPKFKLELLAGSSEERIEEIYPALKGLISKKIEKVNIENIAQRCELVFLALPHKSAMEIAKELLKKGVKVVDLSADYRLKLSHYEKFYTTHLDPTNLDNAVYGLPEIFKEKIKKASLVANPGCYPTATLLGLIPFLPFIEKKVIIDAKSGVSGAGKKCTSSTHYVKINENLFTYNPFKHRHSIEIKEKVEEIAKKEFEIHFIPTLVPLSRGMLVNIYVTLKEEIEPTEILRKFYKNKKFIRIVQSPAEVKNVAGTHFCDIFVVKNGDTLLINTAIDNLLRGASSQAVANGNLMMGLDEEGLPTLPYIP
ncbi:MAG: N-acetyl-gamma-glutamyl-phosphate reductase [Epsilonproteobacteria bacterium]|nr:N-acetyl-gamma-glutamyl-phosphate reductase [Campylobacterota bacterium]